MTFVSLVLIQFFKAYNYRSDRVSVLHRPFANKWLNIAIGWELVLLLAILYVPFLDNLFGTFPLSGFDWLIVGGAGGSGSWTDRSEVRAPCSARSSSSWPFTLTSSLTRVPCARDI